MSLLVLQVIKSLFDSALAEEMYEEYLEERLGRYGY